MSCSPHVIRGGNISLSGQAQRERLPELTGVWLGLGWDVASGGEEFDLDASAVGLGPNRKVLSDGHFVFFNNLASPCGGIIHSGDNRTGAGDGDDETIGVSFATLDSGITCVVFVVSIYDAETRNQSFGQVNNAYIRVMADNNGQPGQVLTRYDLADVAGSETAMIFGEVYQGKQRFWGKPEWKFRAIGQGYAEGLRGIALDYGVNV